MPAIDSSPHRLPNLGKLGATILEHLVEPVIGTGAIQEIKRPLFDKEELDQVAEALGRTEQHFTADGDDANVREAVLELPLANLDSIDRAVKDFYLHPNEDAALAKILATRLATDYPSLPNVQVKDGVTRYIKILKEELINLSPEIRDKLSTLATLGIEEYSRQTAEGVRELVELEKKRSAQEGVRLTAEVPTIKALHSIPAPPRDFTGRIKEIDELVKLLTDGKRASISGLTGMGGVGKSTLASYVAQMVASNFPDATMWIDLLGMDDKPLAPSDAMRQVILAFNPTDDLHKATDAEIAQMYRAVLHGKRALIVLDNAKDAMQVRELLKADCAFIITSRRQFVEQGLLLIRLDVLEERDARELLEKLCARLTEQEAMELTELCGRLPLALRIAGSHLATRPNESTARYIEKLKERRIELLKEYGDEELDVEATFALTYDRLDPETQRRWRFLAVFPAPFDLNAAAYVWKVDPDQAENSLGDLVKESLVEYGEGRFRLHDLLRDFARGR